MAKLKQYILNPDTLLVESKDVPLKYRILRFSGYALLSLLVAFGYFCLYTIVLGQPLPKTVLLKKTNEEWKERMERIDRRLDAYEEVLGAFEVKDEDVYRNIFGLNNISPEIRNAGFEGLNRYSHLDQNSVLAKVNLRLDKLSKKAYVQSKSFEQISAISKQAGDIASCVPVISPVLTDDKKYRLTSRFGYRSDPIRGYAAFHAGIDFAMKPGNPVYSTGDGIIQEVKFELFGYGNSIVVDHGFGYQTRYAHLKTIYVTEGMSIKRGECLGETGNSGKSTGPHLHYEVIYKGRNVNPANFMDLEMPVQEYKEMVAKVASESRNVLTRPHTRIHF